MNDYDMFKNLLVMAAADQSFSEEEIVYLSQRANRLGISEEQFQEALDQVLGRGMVELTIPQDDASTTMFTERAITNHGCRWSSCRS